MRKFQLKHLFLTTIVIPSISAFAGDCPALSGELTIGSSEQSNYKTINEAVEALKCGGVEGPVTFYVEPGVYEEKVTISNISGVSAFNTVEFVAENGIAEDVRITYATTDATVTVTDVSYLTLAKITVEHKEATYGNAIRVDGKSENLSFRDLIVKGVEMPRTGDINACILFTEAGQKKSITIERCEIEGGSIGVAKQSDNGKGTVITGSIFYNQNEAAISLNGEVSPNVNSNVVSTLTTYPYYTGIIMNSVSGTPLVNKNVINTSDRGVGLQINNSIASANENGMITNNIIGVGGKDHAVGIKLTGSTSNLLFDYNTIKLNINEATASTQAYLVNESTEQNITVANSIFFDLTTGAYSLFGTSYMAFAPSENKATESASTAGTTLQNVSAIR